MCPSRSGMPWLSVSAILLCLSAAAADGNATGGNASLPRPVCQKPFQVAGADGGEHLLVPTGWKNKYWADVEANGSELVAHLGARAYFADSCTPGVYNNTNYTRSNLLGKTLRFTVDLAGVGCGCNAALYLTSMGHNTHVSECFDHYCDANNVCGESCAEIDIMEANQHAWHSTLHTETDADGAASGFGGGGGGWNGPRDWSSHEYGIGATCIDTAKPFQVAASFPVDAQGGLEAMHVTLSQHGGACALEARVDDYHRGASELTRALSRGMTPIVSYWADRGMTWLDGPGDDRRGNCTRDSADNCAKSVRMLNFSLEELSSKEQAKLKRAAAEQAAAMEKKYPSNPWASSNAWQQQDGQLNTWGQEQWDSHDDRKLNTTTTVDWALKWKMEHQPWLFSSTSASPAANASRPAGANASTTRGAAARPRDQLGAGTSTAGPAGALTTAAQPSTERQWTATTTRDWAQWWRDQHPEAAADAEALTTPPPAPLDEEEVPVADGERDQVGIEVHMQKSELVRGGLVAALRQSPHRAAAGGALGVLAAALLSLAAIRGVFHSGRGAEVQAARALARASAPSQGPPGRGGDPGHVALRCFPSSQGLLEGNEPPAL